MKKVLIYCASCYGERVMYALDSWEYEVVAFIDDNMDLIGRNFAGKKVLSLKEVKNFEYDYIIISNPAYEEPIRAKLVDNLHIDEDRIIVYENGGMVEYQEERIIMLRKCIDTIKELNLAGNMAELGVYRGDFSRLFNKFLPDKILYLFDTFEGFASDKDAVEKADIERFKDTSVEFVLGNMEYSDSCIIKKGYFPETLDGLDDEFCLVSLDADLYEPILAGLKYFYPRMVTGGYIFVHDYNAWHFTGVKKAVHEFCAAEGVGFVPLTDKNGSVIIVK